MKEFFEAMQLTERIYWYIAIGASVIFIIQTMITFIGGDSGDTGIDADFDGNLDGGDHPFQIFSVRNLVNFFLGVGWTGVSFYNIIGNKILLGIVSIIIGIIFIGIFFVVIRMLMKLAEDNSFKIEDTIGLSGDVYITVPAEKGGKGKVTLSVRGSVHELEAITKNKESIKTGSLIKVVQINDNILVVEPI